MLFINVLTVSPATLHLVSPGLCVDFFDTAPPPHDLLASALTQLFFLRPATVLQVFILWPLSGNQLHAPELGPLLGDTWSHSSQVKFVTLSSLPLISAESATQSCLLQILAGFVIPPLLIPISLRSVIEPILLQIVMGLDAQEAGRSVNSYEGSAGIKESDRS
ncbi:uncharacterized protein UDID_17683 [Ustilago sp. UG-2017a]|nr:uncharacterized protein UDID_17683 [Ustilago sp. UG-2017a]